MNFFQTLNSRPAHISGCAHKGRLFLRHAIWQFRKRFGPYPKRLAFGHSHIWIKNPLSADVCGSLINLFGCYDGNLNLLKILSPRLRNASFFDVGANIGVYSIAASETAECRVVSFEAHPHTSALLAENIQSNRRNNVTVVNAAISDKAGVLRFSNVPSSSINHVLKDNERDGIEVPAIRLDDYAETHNLHPVGLKIDVEGHEVPVLKGARKILTNSVEFAFLEENQPDAIVELMRGHGFLGPWYYHTQKGALSEQKLLEDAIYLKPQLLGWLQQQGVCQDRTVKSAYVMMSYDL